MANLPQSPSMSSANAVRCDQINDQRTVEQLILDLVKPDLQENALLELSKKIDQLPDFAPTLWKTPYAIFALLEELTTAYRLLSPPNLTAAQCYKLCYVLKLLQSVAVHPETRKLFLDAEMPYYVFHFLDITGNSRPYDFLRVSSLGVIGDLVKGNDAEVISYLLERGITPRCLRAMGVGSQLTKAGATCIVKKILSNDMGLEHVCTRPELFWAVCRALGNMVAAFALVNRPHSPLLKHIVGCYICLSENCWACIQLRTCFPERLRDETFSSCLRKDETTRRLLQQLMQKLQLPPVARQGGGGQ